MEEENFKEEIFDVVDEDDQVIDQLPRSVVHAKNLLHRAASVFVFNSSGELLLQKRSANKDEFPGCLTASASGHLGAGEDYDLAMQREMEEEIGLKTELTRLKKFRGGSHNAFEHAVLYRTDADEIPFFDLEEIESLHFFEMKTLDEMIEEKPEQFTPPFLEQYKWYRSR
jgi:isopentenyl-diphosphate delta-isomerase type 1